jgi:hypothetical protein
MTDQPSMGDAIIKHYTEELSEEQATEIRSKLRRQVRPFKCCPILVCNHFDDDQYDKFADMLCNKEDVIIVTTASQLNEHPDIIDRWNQAFKDRGREDLDSVTYISMLESDLTKSLLTEIDYIFKNHIRHPKYRLSAKQYNHFTWATDTTDPDQWESLINIAREQYHAGSQVLFVKHMEDEPSTPLQAVAYNVGYYFLTQEMIESNDPDEEYLFLA